MTTTARITARHEQGDPSRPVYVEIEIGPYDTKAEADVIAAQFPKSHGVHATRCSHPVDGSWLKGSYDDYTAGPNTIWLRPTNVTGAVNEAGVKRYRAIRKHLDRLGYQIDFNAIGDASTYPTIEAFEAAI